MLLAMSYYAVSARFWFKGPRINVEHIDGFEVTPPETINDTSDNGLTETKVKA